MSRDDHSDERLEKRTGSRRPRTVSVSLPDRGQTTQDFAVGIGIFLLAIAFVFSFLPSIVTPFDSSAGGAETAQADRIADRIVSDLSDSGNPNDIDWSEFESEYAGESEGDLAADLGLRVTDEGNTIDRLNVSVQDLEGDAVDHETVGSRYDDQSAASSARIVTFEDRSDCDPACRLIVRVW